MADVDSDVTQGRNPLLIAFDHRIQMLRSPRQSLPA